MLQFREEDFDRMQEVQTRVVRTLLPFRENTEAGLIVFALVRCARTLLRCYPEETRKQLTRLCVDFLEGRTAPRDNPESRLLILQ
jgi:hypothetical protein